MSKSETEAIADLNRTIGKIMRAFKPPENLTVDEWADKYRRLSPEASAEAGPWRTSRTPYLAEPMRAVTDPKVNRIVMVAGSQIGKSEFQLNVIGYIMHQDPGSILYVHPSIEEAKKFSRLRVAPMIRDTPALRDLVKEVRQGRDNAATLLQKSFPGGLLTITGANVPSALASMPIRYIIGDERDRWPPSAGAEGDPWELARARQTTFYNAKAVEVSTPTIKGASNIAASYETGTQERWLHQCPACGEYNEINFDSVHFKPIKETGDHGTTTWTLDGNVEWCCPACGCLFDEATMRRQPTKWVAANPIAYELNHTRSFWLNAFSSPWKSWEEIVLAFLSSKDDPERLKVVYNTLLGQLWEDRGDLETEESMLSRREDYGQLADGSPVDLPEGVLVLTCGVDTQDNRLEYEVVGHGLYGETWGVERGILMGNPYDPELWNRLDGVIDRPYRFRDGRSLRVSVTCVDSGGHYTTEVYNACRARQNRGVFPIKGKGGESVPYISPPSRQPIGNNKKITVWLYSLGVDAGKEAIMDALKVQSPGAKYCHFPLHLEAGYDLNYFNGLLSEHKVLTTTSRQNRWVWEKLPGHKRNEALDCRNYAMAAFRILKPNLFDLDRRMKGGGRTEPARKKAKPKRKPKNNPMLNDW